MLFTPITKAMNKTVYLDNSMYFGMRSKTKHANLRWGDIELMKHNHVTDSNAGM